MQEKAHAKNIAEELSFRILEEITYDTSLLIANSVQSEKYRVLNMYNLMREKKNGSPY